jgi:hypothetical protein
MMKGKKLKKKFIDQFNGNNDRGRPAKGLPFILALLWITVCGAVLYSQTRTEVINLPYILGVAAPVTGRTPARVITENTQYSGTVTWSPEVAGTFAPTTQYTATITLTPKAGHTLQGIAANFFNVAGAVSVRNAANSGVITAVFPPTIGTIINIPAIQGITVPNNGVTPVTAITETAQYRGTVTWSPAVPETFELNTQYTATITLIPKTGYSLEGVAANYFTVSGATSVRNSAGSGVITADFPPTMTITNAVINGVMMPATGKFPVKAIFDTLQFSGTVTWSPEVKRTFEANTKYTATITLIPKPGFTLQGVKDNFFTVSGAENVSNSAGTGVVTAEFPSTKEIKAVHPGDAKLWTIGASAGSSFAAPLVIATVHGTLAPFNELSSLGLSIGAFIELGVDAGLKMLSDEVEDYYSIYPFINFALFIPFVRMSNGKGGGMYGGAGFGTMLANYTFDYAGSIWDITPAVNIFVGFNILSMIDVSYTVRTNIKSADNKLSVGYVYRFK